MPVERVGEGPTKTTVDHLIHAAMKDFQPGKGGAKLTNGPG